MIYTIAVDSGGTFCDCVVFDERGRVTRAKAPSTPPDFEHGVMDAVREAARRLGRPRSVFWLSAKRFRMTAKSICIAAKVICVPANLF